MNGNSLICWTPALSSHHCSVDALIRYLTHW